MAFVQPLQDPTTAETLGLLRKYAEPLPSPDNAETFGEFFRRFGDAHVVLLGEATHGTSEFYRARAAITRELIQHHGFNIVAVEADWPDANRIDRYVRHRTPEPSKEQALARFPTWMWANEEVKAFADWLRAYNEGFLPHMRVEFRGLDIYSLSNSITAVLGYLDKTDPASAKRARARYGCLTPWQAEPAWYGKAVLAGTDPCEKHVAAQLRDLLEHRLEYLRDDDEGFFDATQNARIVHAAEQYYRIMYRGSTESWNLRDRHMFETLRHLLQHRGEDAKAVVWAHNSHIGNASATSMGWSGEFNIGELCRAAFGSDAIAIGFGTDRGTVAAASDWGAAMEIKNVRPARDDSYEYLFRRAGVSRGLTEWRAAERTDLRNALMASRLERAIGVIYRPETEFMSHYFEAILADQFDAMVWFEETNAVHPLAHTQPIGAVETYPFGL